MSYYPPPPGAPYGAPPGAPYGGYNPASFMMCAQPVGLGGKQQMFPLQRPIDLNFVVQQVVMYLMSQGFQVYPFVGGNVAVIQAQHQSFLGFLTDSNKAYTIRICQGQGYVMVETGMTDLLQDLLPLLAAGGTAAVGDDVLHNKLLEILGGGMGAVDAYNLVKDFLQEDQIMNVIMMAIMSAQQMPAPQPYGYGQPYPGYQAPYPGQYPQQPYGQPYPSQQYPPQQPVPQPAQQPVQQPQQTPLQTKMIKCWNCGAEVPADAKFCPYCGANLTPIKCPKCGFVNSPGAKFCANCGAPLAVPQKQ